MRVPPKMKIKSAVGILALSLIATMLPIAPARADDGLLPNAIVVNGRGYGHGLSLIHI